MNIHTYIMHANLITHPIAVEFYKHSSNLFHHFITLLPNQNFHFMIKA